MKQLCILILYFLFSVGIIYGQRTKELKLTFDKSDFLIDESDGQLSISSAKHPIQYGADTSEPGLPFVIVHFLIGADEDYSGVEVSYTEDLLYRDIFVKNNPTYKVRGSNEASEPVKHTTSYSRALYPMENVRYSGTHLVDGYKYITFLVSPFKYQAQRRQLDLLSDISLKIQLSPSKKSPQKAGRAMRDIVQRIVVNGDEMQALYEKPIVNYRNTFSRDIRSGNDPFDYLIITSESQKSAYQKLADWKTRKGVRTKVVTTEQIYSFLTENYYYTHDGHECGALVYKRLIEYFKNNYDIKYVLLGGDVEVIPTLHADMDFGPTTAGCRTPCDLYFSCLNGDYATFEWNNNPSDGGWGTYLDYVDYHPQLILTRLSTNSLSDAMIQINRIIEYERGYNSERWNNKMLMVGNELFSTYDGHSDAEYKDSMMWAYYIHPKWSSGNRFAFFDTFTHHPNGSNYNVTGEHFIDQLSQGYPFVHIDSHGDTLNFRLENDTLWTYEISDFHNPFYSIITTSACTTNAFDFDCMSEHLMRQPHGGIIGYWGASRITKGIDDERNYSEIDRFNILYYTFLFDTEVPRFGEVTTATKLHIIDSLGSNIPFTNPSRSYLYNMNPLGDPEMPVFKIRPREFYYRHLTFDEEDGLKIGFTIEAPTKICIMSLEDQGLSYYETVEIGYNQYPTYGYCFDSLPPNHDYSICFTSPGYKPYIINLYNSGTIQNDSIANDAILWSNQAMIGRDVTTTKPQGPVVVEEGDIFIKAPQGTTIKNNFTLKKGATLTIDPSISEHCDDPNFVY